MGGNRGIFEQKSSILVRGTNVMVSLGLCLPQSNLLQLQTCQDTKAEATEPDLLPASCQAAALRGGSRVSVGMGPAGPGCVDGKALVYAKVSVHLPGFVPCVCSASCFEGTFTSMSCYRSLDCRLC